MTPETPHRPGPVVAVVGPTAVGKSELAEQVAARCAGELVSADSMQVYRGMDIGTAKTTEPHRLVPHHCIDVADPNEPYSVALYQRCARGAIDGCLARGALPVICGGSGLYVRAALDPLDFATEEHRGGEERRSPYEELAAAGGGEELHATLARRDPASAALIHPKNVRRVVRALELLDTGTSYAERHAGLARRESVYDARILGLTMERELLYARIRSRVDRMMESGLVDEVERLLAAGYRDALTSAQAIGYKELVAALDGRVSIDEAVERIKRASTRYAKRQLTWFRADPRVIWVDVTETSGTELLAQALRALHLDIT